MKGTKTNKKVDKRKQLKNTDIIGKIKIQKNIY